MRPRALALCFVLLGVSTAALSFEPRSNPPRQRFSSTPSVLAPRRTTLTERAPLQRNTFNTSRLSAGGVRARIMFATARYEAWVLGGQTDDAMLQVAMTALREARAIAPGFVLDERLVPPKLIALWDEAR